MVSRCRRRQPNLSSSNVCDAYLWIYTVHKKEGMLDIRSINVRRKVRIGTIPELSLRKVGILLCPPIPELYRTILELRKGYISCCHRILSVRNVGIGLDRVGI